MARSGHQRDWIYDEPNHESSCASKYGMALRRVDPSDQCTIFQPLLDTMENYRLDHHGTFRKLAFFRSHLIRGENDSGATALEGFIAGLLEVVREPKRSDTGRATEEWLAWLDTCAATIESEKTNGGWGEDFDETRKRALTLEELIKNIENDPTTGKHVLGKVMRMECSLFKPWRCEGDTPDDELGEGGREERRYCVLRDHFFVTLHL
ncbi:hypothetical protein EDD15DRAFT_2413263 [Pisolithus albus]|nr:hypothetical protein EDD15DRAFT_2413263 [Pisolithus albus]